MTCSPTLRKHSRSGGFAIVAAMCVATAQPGLCAGGRGSPADAERFIERNLDLTDTPLTLEQLRKRIGAATESSRAVANLHVPGQTDHIVTLKAKDLEVEVYAPATGAVLVQRITLTDSNRKLAHDLQIGRSSLDDVYDALGEQAESAQGPRNELARRYETLARNASVTLWFDARERLAGVEWRFVID